MKPVALLFCLIMLLCPAIVAAYSISASGVGYYYHYHYAMAFYSPPSELHPNGQCSTDWAANDDSGEYGFTVLADEGETEMAIAELSITHSVVNSLFIRSENFTDLN